MPKNGVSLADDVLGQMLDRIRSGEWRPGTVIPSQRELVDQFGVSGVPLREALSMMKTLGILEIRQGRKSVVRRLDTQIIQQLFPLAFCLEGEHSFSQIYDLRLTIEPRAAYFAAERRTQGDLDELGRLTRILRTHVDEDDNPAFFEADLSFHVQVAQATGNPFFGLLQRVFSGFIIHAQSWGCRRSYERRLRAVLAHESILDAIANQDPQRASVEMEAHLRYSATHYLRSQTVAVSSADEGSRLGREAAPVSNQRDPAPA